jgi:hypothetical protein
LNIKNNRRRRAGDILLIILTVVFCGATLAASLTHSTTTLPLVHEAFDPALQSISSVDSAADYVRSHTRATDPKSLADFADEFVRRRFYHSYSFFDPSDNWLAYLAGFAWLDLRSPVLPDDILRHPQAACSQQAIVFQAIARKLGFDSGVVRLDHHMVVAVRIAGAWHLYDPDREISPRSFALSSLMAGDPRVLGIYGPAAKWIGISDPAKRGRVSVDDIDRNPAAHASLFDRGTRWLSRYGWALFLGLTLFRLWSRRSRGKSPALSRRVLG